MPAGSVAVVDANGMQMIWLLLHLRDTKSCFDLGFEVTHLLLHLVHLTAELRVVLSHELDSVTRLRLVRARDLILEWLMAFYFVLRPSYQVRVNLILLILLLKKVTDQG